MENSFHDLYFPNYPLKALNFESSSLDFAWIEEMRCLPLSHVAQSLLLSYRPHWDLSRAWVCFDCAAGDGHVAEACASLQEGLEGAGLPGVVACTLCNCCHGPGLHQE